MARRGPARFGGRDGHDPRHVAMHVDDFERQQQHRRAMHAGAPGVLALLGPCMRPAVSAAACMASRHKSSTPRTYRALLCLAAAFKVSC
jgi:hypothetical protein